jgi:hypothetical protein
MSLSQHTTPTAPRRVLAGFAVALILAATVAACGDDDDDVGGTTGGGEATSAPGTFKAEPTAGEWKTWVLGSPTDIRVPAPPAVGSDKHNADLNEVKEQAAGRTPATTEAVNKWSGPMPTAPWTATAYDFVSKSAKNPPLSSRNYALVHVAMYDALVTAWHYKYLYDQAAPRGVETLVPAGEDPSYPSEHAAIAGAASKVLAYLYPSQSALRLDEMADEAAASRVAAGTNTPTDVAAGLELGRAVAEKVIAYGKADGAGTPWDGKRPPGIGNGPQFWEPPPGSPSPPTDPEAGKWKGWVLSKNDQFRPPPPPAFGTPEFQAAAQDVVDVGKNLTQQQKDIAKFWEGNEGTPLPAGIALKLAEGDLLKAASEGPVETRMTVPRTARALAMLNVAMADAGIAAWDGKFTYWNPRPENGIRDLGLDPNWKPYLPTPRFPAYPSGSAGYGGSVQAVMDYLFPANAAVHKQRADEQSVSRVYAGIHWRYDAVSQGAGNEIGKLVVERVKGDGAKR